MKKSREEVWNYWDGYSEDFNPYLINTKQITDVFYERLEMYQNEDSDTLTEKQIAECLSEVLEFFAEYGKMNAGSIEAMIMQF